METTNPVKVHVDADGDMVIVQNPTLAPAIEKSDYEPKDTRSRRKRRR